jgi:predicted CXXCH cytochrome family protein
VTTHRACGLLLLALTSCSPDPAAKAAREAATREAAVRRAATRAPHPASADCAGCHAAEATAWSSSHHARASGTTLHAERFDGQARSFGALRVTPEWRAGQPVFRVQDGAGEQSWAVTGTIGVEPLQQYLLRGARGRVLVAPVAWDLGANRWFDPAPGGASADPRDPLYWAGMVGNWNHLCGECHTTGFTKSYAPETDTYASAASHPVVACAACHGAGAEVASLRESRAQLRACTPCHSRHETLGYGATAGSELLDTTRPALMGHAVFEPDGRNFAPEEPFEWGAFSQSRMHRAGVRCSDCHDPHTGRTRGEGPAVCVRCHGDAAARHPPGSDTADCIRCHLPTRTYMGIHQRHDHGMHSPGPTALGATWTAALSGNPTAGPALLALALDPERSSFVRASAVALLRGQRPTGAAQLRELLGDPDALLRAEVTETLAAWGAVPASSLTDRARAVRFAALKAVILAGAPAAQRTPAFEAVRREFEATTQIHGDLAATWQNVGSVREVLGDRAGAVRAYEEALRREPANGWLRGRVEGLRGPR